jgi:CheY-like chemotaxis protein
VLAPQQPDRTHVLVVDDDPSTLLLVARVLRGAGFVVTATSDPDEALAVVRLQRPAVMLVDRMMPKMDGLTLTRAARAAMPSLPVVLMTALLDQTELTGENLQGFLPKPFRSVSVIAETLKDVVRRNRLARAQEELQQALEEIGSLVPAV